MGQADGKLQTLIVNGEPYLVPDIVYQLVMDISKERDTYANALILLQQKKGIKK
jgi:hypothetical protein